MKLSPYGLIGMVGLFGCPVQAGVAVAGPLECAVPVGTSTYQMQGTMVVIGKPKERLYLHIQHPDACEPGSTDDECIATAYIITGDSVSALDTCGDWTAVEYRGKWGEIYAWVDSTRLSPAEDMDFDVCTIRMSSDDLEGAFKRDTPRLQRELYDAVLAGRQDSVRQFIAKGAHVNMRGPAEDWLISDAVSSGNPELVQALLQAGANPNVSTCGGPMALGFLEKQSGVANEASLVKIAEELTRADAKLSGRANAGWRSELLSAAASHGHTQLLAWLFEHGVDGNDENALRAGINEGQVAAVEMLLTHGADPNKADPSLSPPLFQAVDVGNAALVRVLLDHGANPNVVTVLGTPLKEAIARQRAAGQAEKYGEIVSLLKQHGATNL